MVSIENVTVTGSPVVDTRVTPLTQLGQNVDLDHGRYRNVFYDAGSVAAAPFGTVKSYNTFGSTTPDPHLDGSPTPFTLGVAFGGASVGATYDAVNNQGVYTVRGNTVSVAANLILTAKGSSTGSATLTGLPFVSGTNAAAGQFSCTSYGNMAGLTGAPAGLVPANATTVTLGQGGAAATSFLSDANFTNTTNLRCAGFYFR
jgi:hypothetical protein